jgi:hypothetical protein
VFFHEYEGPELRDAFAFVRNELKTRLRDPVFRNELRAGGADRSTHPEISICNFFDQWGLYFRDGVIDRETFLRGNAGVIDSFWTMLEPAIALMADPEKGNVSFQDFEYMTVQARRWLARNPAGNYPRGEERIKLPPALP